MAEIRQETEQAKTGFAKALKADRRRIDTMPQGPFTAPEYAHQRLPYASSRLPWRTLGRALVCQRMLDWLLYDHSKTAPADFSLDIPENVTTLPEMLIWRRFSLLDGLLF